MADDGCWTVDVYVCLSAVLLGCSCGGGRTILRWKVFGCEVLSFIEEFSMFRGLVEELCTEDAC